MDGENNFDSDTSESWSLVDINDSEHGADLAVDASTIPVNCESCTSKTSENTGEYSSQKNETVQNADSANSLINSLNVASPIEHSKDHQDFQVLYKGKVFQNDYYLEKKSSECNCSKTSFSEPEKIEVDKKFKDIDNDTDCISVISESECNDFKFSAYETDEIWDEKLSECNIPAKSHPNVLKRKRKRLKLNYRESSEESVSSDFMIPDGKYYTNIQSIDFKKSNNELQVKEYQSAPVYRHYRNNVANTVLSLAMGVIFTGVACIAIGHFLGVHDAQHTAGEMMETLKRLQMENVLLHTRLAQLSRAFFTRGNNKLELRAKDESQNCFNRYFAKNARDTNENRLPRVDAVENTISLPEAHANMARIMKFPPDEIRQKESPIMDKNNIFKQTHDQSNFFKISTYENHYSKTPYSATTPVDTREIYNKNLPSEKGGEHPEKISEKNDEMVKRLYDIGEDCSVKSDQSENVVHSRQNCLAVREKDLSRFRWFLIQKKKKQQRHNMPAKTDDLNVTIQCGTPVYLYKFPQPEGYYKYTSKNFADHEGVAARRFKVECPCDEPKFDPCTQNGDFNMPVVRNSTSHITETNKKKTDKLKRSVKAKKEKKRDKANASKHCDSDCKDSQYKKKAQKKNAKPLAKNAKGNDERYFRKFKNDGKKNRKMKEYRCKGDGECDSKPNYKGMKYSKGNYKEKQDDDEEQEGRKKDKCAACQKVRKLKQRNVFPYLYKRENAFRSKKMRRYDVRPDMRSGNRSSCEDCGNRTRNWLYRWAEGREKCRRNQKISEWQFDRAKSRENLRVGDGNWQFSRALDRESRRNSEAYMYFRKKGPKYFQEKEFSDAYSWI